MRRLGPMDVFLSKAAAEVIYLYTKDRDPVPGDDPPDQGHLGQRRAGRPVLPGLVPHAGDGAGDLEHGGQMRGRHLRHAGQQRVRPGRQMPRAGDRLCLRHQAGARHAGAGRHGPPVAAADRSREHGAAEEHSRPRPWSRTWPSWSWRWRRGWPRSGPDGDGHERAHPVPDRPSGRAAAAAGAGVDRRHPIQLGGAQCRGQGGGADDARDHPPPAGAGRGRDPDRAARAAARATSPPWVTTWACRCNSARKRSRTCRSCSAARRSGAISPRTIAGSSPRSSRPRRWASTRSCAGPPSCAARAPM